MAEEKITEKFFEEKKELSFRGDKACQNKIENYHPCKVFLLAGQNSLLERKGNASCPRGFPRFAWCRKGDSRRLPAICFSLEKQGSLSREPQACLLSLAGHCSFLG